MTLREYLLQNDLSTQQFANLLNRPHRTVVKWVTGETDITLRDAFNVLLITDGYVSPHDFLEEMEIRDKAH